MTKRKQCPIMVSDTLNLTNTICTENCAWYIEKQGCAVTVFVKSVSGMLKAGNLLKVMLGRPDLLKKLKKVVKKRETKRTS